MPIGEREVTNAKLRPIAGYLSWSTSRRRACFRDRIAKRGRLAVLYVVPTGPVTNLKHASTALHGVGRTRSGGAGLVFRTTMGCRFTHLFGGPAGLIGQTNLEGGTDTTMFRRLADRGMASSLLIVAQRGSGTGPVVNPLCARFIAFEQGVVFALKRTRGANHITDDDVLGNVRLTILWCIGDVRTSRTSDGTACSRRSAAAASAGVNGRRG